MTDTLIDQKAFFDAVRKAPFGGRLTKAQVEGLQVILREWREIYPDARVEWVGNSLAQVHRETGGLMQPIKETVMSSHRDRNPSDRTVIQRLDRAYAKGQLTWVTTPYWRDGWFGRGLIQITHERNYRKLGDRLGVDLVGDPSLALDPEISARIAIVGMVEGLFTGRSLRDVKWDEPDPKRRARAVRGARRIVNGPDGSDAEVAAMHEAYVAALLAAGYAPIVEAPLPPPRPEPEERTPVYDAEPEIADARARLADAHATIAEARLREMTQRERPAKPLTPPETSPPTSFWALIGRALASIFSRRT